MEVKDKIIAVNCLPSAGIILSIMFFLARIFDKIDWSWWWVFSPLWLPLAFILGISIIVGIIYLISILIGIWLVK